MLGLESRKKTVEDVDQPPQSPAFESDIPLDLVTNVRQYALDEPLSQRTSVSDSDGLRHCDTVCDNGDYGTFTISYDAPSPRSRCETRSLTHEEDEDTKTGFELYDSEKRRESPQTNTDSCNKRHSAPAAKTGALKKLPRPLPVATRTVGKALTGIPVARSVGDVARASRDNNTAPLHRAVKKGRQTPPGPQSSWSCWRQETGMSDAVSEAGLSSGAGGRRLAGEQQHRSSAPRSAPAVTTRSNRTFALRCAAKKRAEATASPSSPSVSSPAKPSRSRSAENNARLALAARSRSGSRVRSQKEQEDAQWRARRPSGDSSTSLSSNLSVATHDGSYFRRDGGRYSMRVEKSSTTSCLASAAKRLQVVDKSKPGGTQPRAKQSVAESKEMTAWKRRKEYDPRKSVAEALARRGNTSQIKQHSSASPVSEQHNAGQVKQRSSASPVTEQHDAGLGTADEIAKLSNAVAYNLSVLSESSQSDAVTLVSYRCNFTTWSAVVFPVLCAGFAYTYLWLSCISWFFNYIFYCICMLYFLSSVVCIFVDTSDFVLPSKGYGRHASRGYYVSTMSHCPVPTSAFFILLCTNTERLWLRFEGGNQYYQQMN